MRLPTTSADACDTAREWLSAHRDGEALDDADARAHIEGCAGCRAWEARVDAFTPRLRVRPTGAMPDVTARARALWTARQEAARDRQTVVARVLLALSGAAAIVLAVFGAVGLGGALGNFGQHLGYELHAFEAALGIGFSFAAARPDRYARSLLPVTSAVAALTLHPFFGNVSRSTVDLATEASHLPTLIGLAGLLLLVDAARRERGQRHQRKGHVPA